LTSDSEAFNLLLVDAEGPVNHRSPWQHLKARVGDGWDRPGVGDERCHLMIQAMEAWLIADREALRDYYGQHFHENALPDNRNVEQIEKDRLLRSLDEATRHSRKGKYHKTRHAPELLERIRSQVVRQRAPSCDRLFETLLTEIKAA
jgi:hypothetical protein